VSNPTEATGAAPAGAIDWDDPSTLPLDEVRELFQTLAKALRAYQLYDENNPVYKRFVGNLRESFQGLWGEVERLPVQVEEDRITWLREEVYRSDSRADSLAFLFYKDGIRDITFLPGIEDDELEPLLSVLQRARNLRPESDDLLTILWEADLTRFQYHYVDVLAEGLDGPLLEEHTKPDLRLVLTGELTLDDIPEADEAAAQVAGAEQAAPLKPKVSAEDLNPTLYSLDAREMEQLRKELDREMARDLRGDVLAALFDRLEEPRNPGRQTQILAILRTLLPNFLSRGEITAAATVLEEVGILIRDEQRFDGARRSQAGAMVEEISSADSIEELIRALQDGSIRPAPRELSDFLRHLGAGALEPLIRAAEETEEKELRPVLREACRGIAEQNRGAILELLGSDEPAVVAGATRVAGRIQLTEAGTKLSALLSHEDERVQLAAIEAAVNLKASTAAGALEAALQHSDRNIRMSAARGLAHLRYKPAEKTLKQVITSKQVRQADLSEKIAFFEAYGILAGAAGVSVLDRMLNSRGFLGRRESPDVRACAALALGKIRTAAARKALDLAAKEDDPVVRSAVNRALRGED
jgi:HEAT repeat protein